jgi:predicted secreted protein
MPNQPGILSHDRFSNIMSVMIAVGTGAQKISGIYQRSWEPLTGNETRFDMTIVIV